MDKKRIMVVDDEEDFLTLTKLNLEMTQKYEVTTLSNAKDIMSVVRSFKPELILLDLLMPSIGGFEVCQMLNNDSMGKGIPIIILSALDKEQEKLKAYKLGVVDFLSKPIETEELFKKVEKALQYK